MLNCCADVRPVFPVAVTSNEYAPEAVTVPDNSPFALVTDNPDGRLPYVTTYDTA